MMSLNNIHKTAILCLIIFFFQTYSHGAVMEDIVEFRQVAVAFIKTQKGWDEGELHLSMRAIRQKQKVAIFQGSHNTMREKYLKELKLKGAISQGEDPSDIIVFVDMITLKAFEANPNVVKQMS